MNINMYKDINEIELLSPAGDIDSFKAAVQNGADAIYMGIDKFNARIMTNNFDMDEYIKCIEYAHLRNVKVFLTINVLMSDEDIKQACKVVLELYSKGLDAIIVQDLGFAMVIKKIIPNLQIHASTQMSIYNLEQVKYLEQLGFSRVVLARELTIEEIEYICKNTTLEVEVFVHGALCVSVSGQCLMSYCVGGRSANKGNCAQPCRMKYKLYSNSEEKISNRYLLSKKDIYGLEHIDKLINAGVKSFKIEGRNKIPEYVAITTSIYRKYINEFCQRGELKISQEDKLKLKQIFNRDGICSGYLDGVKYSNSITNISAKNTGIYLGEVCDQKSVYVKLKLEEDFNMKDGIEIYSRDNVYSNIITCIKNEKYVTVNKECKKGEYIWIGDISKKMYIGSKIYKTSSYSLNKEYQGTYINSINLKKIIIMLEVYIIKDNKLKVIIKNINNKISNENLEIEVELEYIPSEAKTKSLTKEDIKNVFDKTNDTSIKFEVSNVEIDDNLFVPTSVLNELRRLCISKITELFKTEIDVSNELNTLDYNLENRLKKFVSFSNSLTDNTKNDKELTNEYYVKNQIFNSLFVYKYDDEKEYIRMYEDKYKRKLNRIDINLFDYIKNKEAILNKYLNKVDIYIYLPSIISDKAINSVLKNFEEFLKQGVKGYIIGNIGYLKKLIELKNEKGYDFKIIADYSINISNRYTAAFLKKEGVDSIVLAYDATNFDMFEMSKIIDLELIENFVTVMTSRYCMLGSFLGNITEKSNCPRYCKDGNSYYIKDINDLKYNIICDDTECIMKITKKINNVKNFDIKHNIKSIRYCLL